MRFKHRGWFARYLEFRWEHPLGDRLPSAGVRLVEGEGHQNEIDQAVYCFLEPTGLLYGWPIAYPFSDLTYSWRKYYDRRDRALMIYLDALFAVLVADRTDRVRGLRDDPDPLGAAAEVVQEYYLSLARKIGGHSWGSGFARWLRLRRSGEHDVLEATLRARTVAARNIRRVRSHLSGAFLFLDLYGCLVWQRRRVLGGLSGEEIVEGLEALHQELAAQRQAVAEFIIAALYSDRGVDVRNHRLLNGLLQAARLPESRAGAVEQRVRFGIEVENVETPPMPWLLRRYILGLAVMVTLIDRSVTQGEGTFLTKLAQHLGLSHDELSQSRAAVESFVLTHRESLKWDYALPQVFDLAEDLKERATIAIRLNMDRLTEEIQQTKELYSLLMKSRHTRLTNEEKRKVRAQLTDIAKTIPALAVFALPGGAIALPILIKLLPFNLLPSAFED